MLSKNKIILVIVTAVLLVCSPVFLHAQGNDDDFREKIENIKLDKMVKKMELDETTAGTFRDKYKAFSKSLRELNMARAKAYRLMTENIESGNGLDSLVEQVLSYESQINEKKMAFVSDLKSLLTAKQLATMIVFERKFNTELKKMLKNYLKENKKD